MPSIIQDVIEAGTVICSLSDAKVIAKGAPLRRILAGTLRLSH
jgi:hypothetical protein